MTVTVSVNMEDFDAQDAQILLEQARIMGGKRPHMPFHWLFCWDFPNWNAGDCFLCWVFYYRVKKEKHE